MQFDPLRPIEEIEPLSLSISTLAHKLETVETRQVNPLLFEHIEHLHSVYLNAKEEPEPRWEVNQVYSVHSLSIDRLNEIVKEKTKKLSGYQFCSHYWLLVVVDFMDPAQDQDLVWPDGASLEESPFEKVLLYKPQFRKVLELYACRRRSCYYLVP